MGPPSDRRARLSAAMRRKDRLHNCAVQVLSSTLAFGMKCDARRETRNTASKPISPKDCRKKEFENRSALRADLRQRPSGEIVPPSRTPALSQTDHRPELCSSGLTLESENPFEAQRQRRPLFDNLPKLPTRCVDIRSLTLGTNGSTTAHLCQRPFEVYPLHIFQTRSSALAGFPLVSVSTRPSSHPAPQDGMLLSPHRPSILHPATLVRAIDPATLPPPVTSIIDYSRSRVHSASSSANFRGEVLEWRRASGRSLVS
ncbi:hypothetical protein FA13DRAFT_174096 [Coprinellus micaceus]|uniref:Uncharacterized protein n=1 Tax=Coprinellus micaceus TaxID=71717 RepID=A0A4Y7SGQ7_COPMI|nr:hypothetical protein FA13DRAFT_174096 [Coprinellus micaceus]